MTTAAALAGRCGLYCGSCFIHAASRAPALGERRAAFARKVGCDADQVRCEGCGVLTPDCWGADCTVVACLNDRGFERCDECSGVDACERYADLERRYEGAPRRNLARRRAIGTDAWLAEQALARGCRDCGKPMVYGENVCVHCGAPRNGPPDE